MEQVNLKESKVKRISILLIVTIILMLLVSCILFTSTTPQERFRTTLVSYAQTLEILTTYRQLGLIDDEQALEIEVYRVQARCALDSWQQALNDGVEPSTAIEEFNVIINYLLDTIIEIERRKNNE